MIAIVLGFVNNIVPEFSARDIVWVRSMKASKYGVLNCQCATVLMASRVRSEFASLVKQSNPPSFIGKTSISFAHQIGTRVRISLMKSIAKRQKEHDPTAVCSVSAFTARPLLRVGGKNQGTRFLSYVDAVKGFKHLLKQEDLDRALSLCTGLKGHLKSRFLVLSDDRVLPPYQGPRHKRTHPEDEGETSGKRVNAGQRRQPTPAPQATGGYPATQGQASAAAVFSQVQAQFHQLGPQAAGGVPPANGPAFSQAQFQPVFAIGSFPPLPQTQPLPGVSFIPSLTSAPPPSFQLGAVDQLMSSGDLGFQTVRGGRSRGRGKGRGSQAGQVSGAVPRQEPVRTTPQRAAKVKKNTVLSPDPEEDFESCGEEEGSKSEGLEDITEKTA